MSKLPSNSTVLQVLRVATLALIITTSDAAVRFVKAGATGTNNGTSWTNAYTELVSAIGAAQSGDQIWIASGTYFPDFNPSIGAHTGDRTLRFAIKSNVSLFGGFAGNETSRSQRNPAINRTILSGDIGQLGVFSDNTRTIMATVDSTAVTGALVEGVVFAGGNANDPAELGSGIVGGSGGAIYVYQGSLEIRHCSFVGNYAVYGGAVSVRGNGSALLIANCLFASNTAQYIGGAISMSATSSPLTIRNSTIVNNVSSRGAAIGVSGGGVTSSYFNNVIHSNSSTSTGWQLVEVGSGASVLENNILQAALIPVGTNNLVVASPKLARYPSAGTDGRWGSMDDVLDGRLAGDSAALNFGVAAQLPVDSTDMDGDSNVTEAVPYDLLNQTRQLYSAPDAGAFEYLDLETVAPTLTSPTAGSRVKKPVVVSFVLPEAALSGSVAIIFDNGTVQTTLGLAASKESLGAHTLSFDPVDPVNTSAGAITSGNAIPDGQYSVILTYRDTLGNAAAIATSLNVVIDNITLPPSFTAPASGVSTKSAVSVSFNLPEAGQVGTVTVTFHDGVTPRTLALASARSSAGNHTFSFNPASPVSSSGGSVVSAPAIPDGLYSVSLSYQDAVGNAAATVINTNVRIDTITLTPSLAFPTASSSTKSPVNVAFTLPEQALAGSVKLGFSGAAARTLTLSALMEASGARSFSFNPSNPLLSPQVATLSGGSSLPDGLYTVSLSYQDALGNAIASISSSNIRIDTTPPTLSLPSSVVVEATSPAGAIATYSASASDIGTGVASSSFSPLSGATFPIGATTVNAMATDLVGNQSLGSFVVNVRDTTAPIILPRSNVVVEADQFWGSVVTYAPGIATDAVGVTTLTYSQSSGTPFPLGTSTVIMFALDAANNLGMRTFTVTVQDTTQPVVTQPANVTVDAAGPFGAVVSFGNAVATDLVGVTSVTYSQGSGSTFAVGTTVVTVTAKDAANNIGTATFTVTVRPLSPADTWRYTHFGSIGNLGDAADNAAPDHDGITNLMKYGLVIVPGTSGVAAMPRCERRTYAEGDRLALVLTRDPSRSDLRIEVQATSDLNGLWTSISASEGGLPFTGVGFVTESDAGGGLKSVEIRDTVTIDGAIPSRFMRIKVARLPAN